ncbi:MFS transporter [Nocardioides sp. LHG3406-4]|uniref:MFS transporter n=1 Tax=Nocardioides sp. LHG3406-4 TaxID=2804575 RepID=UPI003CEF9A4B
MTWADSMAPLRERNFRFYFASRSVNLLGTMMATVALAFAVLEITDDPAALGQVLAAHTVPMVALLLWGGVIADRFPRETVLQFSNLTSALSQGAIAVLVITGSAQLWMLIVLSAVHGTVSALSFPAMASIMPQLVPRDQLQPANALVSLVRGALTIIGPTIGALLVVTVGAGWAVAVDAATWLASAILLGFVHVPRRTTPDEKPGTFAELAAGWSYVRRTTWLWAVVLGFGFLNAIHAGAWFTLGPAVAKQTFGAQGWGVVLSAEAIGLLLTTLVLLRVPLQRPLLYGMAGIACLGVPIFVLGAHPNLWWLVPAAFVAGVGTEVFGMGWNLAMQEHVPDEMLSRAYSYDALGSFVAIPVGQLAFGPLAAAYGFRDVLMVSGVVYVLVCGLVLCSREVRRLPRVVATDRETASEQG